MDDAPTALYGYEQGHYIGLENSRGPWNHHYQIGGAVLALLGHVIEDVQSSVPNVLARLSVDLARPVPVGRPMTVQALPRREGKKIQLIDLSLSVGAVELVVARALRIRTADLVEDVGALSTGEEWPQVPVPPPDDPASVRRLRGGDGFVRHALDMCWSLDKDEALHTTWVRLRTPVIAGEPVRPTSRVAMAMDCVNLLGADLSRTPVSGINPDVTAHFARPFTGEWIALTGATITTTRRGLGVSTAFMSDEHGPLGTVSCSHLLQPAARPPDGRGAPG